MIKEADHKTRALLLSEIWTPKDSASSAVMLKLLGFNANELAYYGIAKTIATHFIACYR